MSTRPVPTADDITNAAHRAMRIAAFGAIRRALREARKADEQYEAYSRAQKRELAYGSLSRSAGIRTAIRAAMRTDS